MMIPAERDKTPYSTLCVALSVLILITSVIAPLRLPFLLIPLSFFLAAYGMGLLLEKAIPSIASSVSMLTLVMRLGTGISLLGCATAVLGLMGLYRLTALLVIGALGWGLVHLGRSRGASNLLRPSCPSLISGVVLGIVWAIAWLWATIPPTFYDELAYHLPLAQYALASDHLAAVPWLFFSFMPHLSDLLLGWGLALGGEIGARAMHIMFWLAIWIAAWALVETIIVPRTCSWIGYLMAGAFASSSTFFFLGTLPFAETSLTFAVLASAALIARPGTSVFWLPLGLLWGLTVSVKLSGWMWVIGGALAALAMRWPAAALAKAGLVTLATTLPWWGRAWWLTGNPIFPMGYRVLGGLHWSDESQARLQGDLPSYADPLNPVSLLKLPYDMVMVPERFGSASDCGPLAVGNDLCHGEPSIMDVGIERSASKTPSVLCRKSLYLLRRTLLDHDFYHHTLFCPRAYGWPEHACRYAHMASKTCARLVPYRPIRMRHVWNGSLSSIARSSLFVEARRA